MTRDQAIALRKRLDGTRKPPFFFALHKLEGEAWAVAEKELTWLEDGAPRAVVRRLITEAPKE